VLHTCIGEVSDGKESEHLILRYDQEVLNLTGHLLAGVEGKRIGVLGVSTELELTLLHLILSKGIDHGLALLVTEHGVEDPTVCTGREVDVWAWALYDGLVLTTDEGLWA
jgi:hypothetical protein